MKLFLSSIQMRFLPILLFFFGFGGTPVFASGWDYSAGFGSRSLPFGAAFNGQLGWNEVLWGDSASKSPFGHGLLRPSVRMQTSGLTTSGEAKLGFYPIPILGVNAGWSASYRNIAGLHTLSCELYECRGLLTGQFIQPRAVVGYAGAFLVVSYRVSDLKDHVAERPFAEERSTLAGALGGDRLSSLEAVMGYSVSDQNQALLLLAQEKMKESGNQNALALLAWRHQMENPLWKWTAAVGAYESSTQSWGPAVAFAVQWTPVPSMEWF